MTIENLDFYISLEYPDTTDPYLLGYKLGYIDGSSEITIEPDSGRSKDPNLSDLTSYFWNISFNNIVKFAQGYEDGYIKAKWWHLYNPRFIRGFIVVFLKSFIIIFSKYYI